MRAPLRLLTAAEQPADVPEALRLIETVWPSWMLKASPGRDAAHLHVPPTDWAVFFERFPTLQLIVRDPTMSGAPVVAVANSVPLPWCGDAAALPEEGWDWALTQALSTAEDATRHTLCAMAVTIAKSHQGRGLSREMLLGLKDAARAAGLSRMLAPVRPNHKHRHPRTPMADYIARQNPEGLPADPWLRTHIRIDAVVVKPCTRSMQMVGRIEDWEQWLGSRLPRRDGLHVAPTLLAPLFIDRQRGLARYTEPNVWVEHPLSTV